MAPGVTEWTGRWEAILVGVIAGLLLLGDGFYLLANNGVLPFGSVDDPTAGATSVAAGLAVVFLAIYYRTYGEFRGYIGVLLILISGGDLWFGGGFWAGSLLGTAAGVLVVALPPTPRFHSPG